VDPVKNTAKKRYPTYLIYLFSSLFLLMMAASWGLYAGWLVPVDWDDPRPLYLEDSTIEQVHGGLFLDYSRHGIAYVPLQELPDDLVNAFIAIEDSRFFQHRGIDLISIFRAMAVNLQAGEVVQGGSTITQQLARNLFLGHQRTLERKVAEIGIAFQLERQFTKEAILEMYLNQIYFGHGNWGVNQAARAYFQKEATALTLGEAAVLAGLVQSPGNYAPTAGRWGLALARQRVVLNRMAELNYITPQDAREALLQEPLSSLLIKKTRGLREPPGETSLSFQ